MNDIATHRPTSGATAEELAVQLGDVRSRSRRLTEDLSTDQLMGPMLPIVNPILWEIGHVGWFHEFWTLRHVHRNAPLIERADLLWNSSTVPHATRWDLDLPDRESIFAFLSDVLDRQRDRLSGIVETPARYFYELSIRHEDMHVEALAYTRQTHGYAQPQDLGGAFIRDDGAFPGDAEVPGGSWRLGSTPADGFVFDNEKWAHDIEVAAFRIAKAPVTNAEFAAFVDDEGYQRREFWSDDGWAWREREGAERPKYWLPKREMIWMWRRYDRVEVLSPHAPVVFVNWYEADAWCRWAKRRLPTEAEWEVAAIGEAANGGTRLAAKKRRWPWGDEAPRRAHANLDFTVDGPLDVASCSAGDSAFGCRQMIGNVWEWTASDFVPFPGFSRDPYEDYSEPWFNSRKVLRGGSWATSTRIGRPSYRNFFTPERNDVIAGFRTCVP
ncbi:MAG: ergothioneine biosynthesis protein EgtB [Rhizobiales bacterium]|nr:ergothioneine biosynthesis protein EgtB [Hyphomicrobiales bacterium]